MPRPWRAGGRCDAMSRAGRIVWMTAVAVGASAAAAALVVRDQLARQRRHLFNPLALRRVAALEHMARQEPTVDTINLLRDYITWEPRRALRNRALALVERMEREAAEEEVNGRPGRGAPSVRNGR